MLIGDWHSSVLLKVIYHIYWNIFCDKKYKAESFISSCSSLSIIAYHIAMSNTCMM